ncbi:RluA family pseudouridine synthase [Borrelia miyamotoi]|uniref:RluA family pseudouridine synthase n=1 Tax=Borrelia miyamotoi TaxID=47466 RepID=A0AAX3JKH7_9SPIR|nr:RluA family pseudouridine synthase [Borrelia miyamotoi]QFP41569.1 RluA family pseudouridine synthase [Borrelia miyamotoi]QFP48398.1 RluA family pseudouridine synthase [Borrelia miyamotoi]QGT56159.1 RluA family pseudouridine synthase [Borrelia miyamotoi]QGT56234.1 RluA family pseudouridine synthase [Borrelia miyamotoi]WAZ71475.1 RluA family pseudouridine synthase [Borrelia miyamotoi]
MFSLDVKSVGKYSVINVLKNDNGKRLDAVLIKFLKFPKSKIIKHIRNGDILLNNLKVSFSHRVFKDDEIYLYKSLLHDLSFSLRKIAVRDETNVLRDIKKRIVYEDEDLLVINKRKGTLVHGDKYSLDNLINAYLLGENLKSLSFKPSAVHRLDRNTSGLVIFAKNIGSARLLSQAFSHGLVTKKYLALLDGEIKKSLTYKNFLYRDRIARKTFVIKDTDKCNAITYVKPILVSKFSTLVEVSIKTGFTHQIRAQCAFNKHALINDKKYDSKFRRTSYFLHSFLINFNQSLFLRNEFFVGPSSDFLKQIRNIFGVYDFKEFIE